jgi:hypothetical protein
MEIKFLGNGNLSFLKKMLISNPLFTRTEIKRKNQLKAKNNFLNTKLKIQSWFITIHWRIDGKTLARFPRLSSSVIRIEITD